MGCFSDPLVNKIAAVESLLAMRLDFLRTPFGKYDCSIDFKREGKLVSLFAFSKNTNWAFSTEIPTRSINRCEVNIIFIPRNVIACCRLAGPVVQLSNTGVLFASRHAK